MIVLPLQGNLFLGAMFLPNLTPEDGRKCYEYGDHVYVFETVESGTYTFGVKRKIPQNPQRLKGLFEIYGHPINKSKNIEN